MKNLFYFMILLCFTLIQTSCKTHRHTSALHNKVDESKIFINPHQQPYYLHGGNEGLMNDLYATLLNTAPATQNCVSGRAAVTFSISKDGQIDPNSIKVIRNRSVPEDYLDAAIEAIKSLGKFEPGKMNGIPQKVSYTLPIIYPIPLDRIATSE